MSPLFSQDSNIKLEIIVSCESNKKGDKDLERKELDLFRSPPPRGYRLFSELLYQG